MSATIRCRDSDRFSSSRQENRKTKVIHQLGRCNSTNRQQNGKGAEGTGSQTPALQFTPLFQLPGQAVNQHFARAGNAYFKMVAAPGDNGGWCSTSSCGKSARNTSPTALRNRSAAHAQPGAAEYRGLDLNFGYRFCCPAAGELFALLCAQTNAPCRILGNGIVRCRHIQASVFPHSGKYRRFSKGGKSIPRALILLVASSVPHQKKTLPVLPLVDLVWVAGMGGRFSCKSRPCSARPRRCLRVFHIPQIPGYHRR